MAQWMPPTLPTPAQSARHPARGGDAVRARGREVYIIAAVVAVVLVVAWYFLLFSPTRDAIAQTDQELQTAQTSLNAAQQEASSRAAIAAARSSWQSATPTRAASTRYHSHCT